MEVESSSPKTKEGEGSRKRKRRGSIVCLWVTVGVILLVILVIVILVVTVFKARRPVTTVDSISLKDLRVSFDIARLGLKLNVSLGVDLSVKNPNKVGFKYSNSSASLSYRGEVVGEAPIPAGKIGPDQTEHMNITLTVLADRLLTNAQLYSDVVAGTITLHTYTRMPGKVTIFNLFKIHAITTTTCDISIFVSNRTLGDQNCKYKTKL